MIHAGQNVRMRTIQEMGKNLPHFHRSQPLIGKTVKFAAFAKPVPTSEPVSAGVATCDPKSCTCAAFARGSASEPRSAENGTRPSTILVGRQKRSMLRVHNWCRCGTGFLRRATSRQLAKGGHRGHRHRRARRPSP
jgi:hypothetical protein